MGLSIFGLTFNLYGLILGVAILAAYFAAGKYARRISIEKEITESLFWWVVAGGIIGARLYHVVDKWQEIYSLDPKSILYIWNGGLGIWGAIIGGVTAMSVWYLAVSRKHVIPAKAGIVIPAKAGIYLNRSPIKSGMTERVDFLNLLDIVFFGLPLGQAIGRWGNFFNNEIIGKNGEPLFLYESMLDLALFGVLAYLVRKSDAGSEPVGRVAGVYLVGYGTIRLLLEQYRPDEIVWRVASLPVASVVSLIAIGVGGILLISRKRA